MVNRVSNERRRFTYQPPEQSKYREREERSKGQFDRLFKQGFDSFIPTAGDNAVRFLPATYGHREPFALEIYIHFSVGAQNGRYLCLSRMRDERCPICDAALAAKKDGDIQGAKDLSAKRAAVAWIIDRNDKRGADKAMPKLWQINNTLDGQIVALMEDHRNKAFLNVDDPDAGFDFFFRTVVGVKKLPSGAKVNDYLGAQFDRVDSPIFDDQSRQDEVLDYIQDNPLPSVLNFYSADYLEKVLYGTAAAKDEDLEPEPADDDRRAGNGGDLPRRSRAVEDVDEEPPFAEEPPRRAAREPADRDEGRPYGGEREEPRARQEAAPERGERVRVRRETEPEPEPEPRRFRSREPAPETEPPPRRRPREEPVDERRVRDRR